MLRTTRLALDLIRQVSDGPRQVTMFVTDRCNLSCNHCFYWRHIDDPGPEPTLEEIQALARGLVSVGALTITGGEPTLRSDLPEIVAAFGREGGVRRLHIPTNGYTPDRIEAMARRMVLADPTLDLTVKVSLDGDEKIHNRIRGNPESHQRAMETCRRLAALRAEIGGPKLGLLFTLSSWNQHLLARTIRDMAGRFGPDQVSLNLTRSSPRDPGLKEIDPVLYRSAYGAAIAAMPRFGLHSFLFRRYKAWVRDRILDTLETGSSGMACQAGRRIVVVDPTLRVHPCETLDEEMGDLRRFDYDLGALWCSERAREVRHRIERLGCSCTEECQLQQALFADPWEGLRALW